MATPTVWTLELRENLEIYLKDGFSVKKISEKMEISVVSIYNEISKGVTPEEYENGQYVKYSAQKSIESQLEAYKHRLIYGRAAKDEDKCEDVSC